MVELECVQQVSTETIKDFILQFKLDELLESICQAVLLTIQTIHCHIQTMINDLFF
jgi:hypothetical protein